MVFSDGWLLDQHLARTTVPETRSGPSGPHRLMAALLSGTTLVRARHEAHGLAMSDPSNRTCQCGAIYARNEHMAAAREMDSYQCVVCDRTLENWNSAWVPVYRLIVRPLGFAGIKP